MSVRPAHRLRVSRARGEPTVLVLVTCPTRRQAQRLADALVRRKLAACVNIGPAVDSRFWWQGKLDRAREVLLFIKTTRAALEPLRRAVVALHPYDVPELIALPIRHGHPPYLRWLRASVRLARRAS